MQAYFSHNYWRPLAQQSAPRIHVAGCLASTPSFFLTTRVPSLISRIHLSLTIEPHRYLFSNLSFMHSIHSILKLCNSCSKYGSIIGIQNAQTSKFHSESALPLTCLNVRDCRSKHISSSSECKVRRWLSDKPLLNDFIGTHCTQLRFRNTDNGKVAKSLQPFCFTKAFYKSKLLSKGNGDA